MTCQEFKVNQGIEVLISWTSCMVVAQSDEIPPKIEWSVSLLFLKKFILLIFVSSFFLHSFKNSLRHVSVHQLNFLSSFIW
jgi:hypothetical protein